MTKKCECGCGKEVNNRFISGHNTRLISQTNMIIEADGDYWHKYPEGREIDHIRNNEMKEKGYKVLRLWEHQIKDMNSTIFNEILNYNLLEATK